MELEHDERVTVGDYGGSMDCITPKGHLRATREHTLPLPSLYKVTSHTSYLDTPTFTHTKDAIFLLFKQARLVFLVVLSLVSS